MSIVCACHPSTAPDAPRASSPLAYPTRYRSGADALAAMVDLSGLDRAGCARRLVDEGYWPASLSDAAATARMRACLNPDKADFLKLAEVVALMRYTGRLDPLYFVCDELGVERPAPRNPNAEVARCAEQLRALLTELPALARALDASLAGAGAPPVDPPPLARFHRR